MSLNRCLRILSVACTLLGAFSSAGAAERLANSKWLVTAIAGGGGVDNLRTTLEFGADGRAGGQAGCNRWTASWRVGGDRLTLDSTATTRMACLPAVADQEQKFLAALAAVSTFRIDNGSLLILLDQKGTVVIRASRI